MKTYRTFVLSACLMMTLGFPLLGQDRQRQAPGVPQTRPPLTRDQREDLRDRREDIRDRREDVRDRREDVRDAQRNGGVGDRREDVRERREDVRDRREDVRDRMEDRLDRNPRFAAHLRDLLPRGTRPRNAIAGFKNEGQFYAALHASKNLNIPFDQLKAQVIGNDAVSLGQAIHAIKAELSEDDIRNAVKRAENDAQETEKTSSSAD